MHKAREGKCGEEERDLKVFFSNNDINRNAGHMLLNKLQYSSHKILKGMEFKRSNYWELSLGY